MPDWSRSFLQELGCSGGAEGAEQAKKPAGTSDLLRHMHWGGRMLGAGQRFVGGVAWGCSDVVPPAPCP